MFTLFKQIARLWRANNIRRKDARILGMKKVSNTFHSPMNWSNYHDFSNWVLKTWRFTLVCMGFLMISSGKILLSLITKSCPKFGGRFGSQGVSRCCTQRWLSEIHRAQPSWSRHYLEQTLPEVENRGINEPKPRGTNVSWNRKYFFKNYANKENLTAENRSATCV